MAGKRKILKKFTSVFSGDFMLERGLTRQVGFIFYLFLLVSLFIIWNLYVESSLVKTRNNDREIESLIIARNQRNIELLSLDRRSTIEEMLEKNKSQVKAPESPAIIIKAE